MSACSWADSTWHDSALAEVLSPPPQLCLTPIPGIDVGQPFSHSSHRRDPPTWTGHLLIPTKTPCEREFSCGNSELAAGKALSTDLTTLQGHAARPADAAFTGTALGCSPGASTVGCVAWGRRCGQRGLLCFCVALRPVSTGLPLRLLWPCLRPGSTCHPITPRSSPPAPAELR